jgi:hypothetical protein
MGRTASSTPVLRGKPEVKPLRIGSRPDGWQAAAPLLYRGIPGICTPVSPLARELALRAVENVVKCRTCLRVLKSVEIRRKGYVQPILWERPERHRGRGQSLEAGAGEFGIPRRRWLGPRDAGIGIKPYRLRTGKNANRLFALELSIQNQVLNSCLKAEQQGRSWQ